MSKITVKGYTALGEYREALKILRRWQRKFISISNIRKRRHDDNYDTNVARRLLIRAVHLFDHLDVSDDIKMDYLADMSPRESNLRENDGFCCGYASGKSVIRDFQNHYGKAWRKKFSKLVGYPSSEIQPGAMYTISYLYSPYLCDRVPLSNIINLNLGTAIKKIQKSIHEIRYPDSHMLISINNDSYMSERFITSPDEAEPLPF